MNHDRKLVVIGKGSTLYRSIGRTVFNEFGKIDEFSHSEVFTGKASGFWSIAILFALSRSQKENSKLLRLALKMADKVLVVGSCAMLSERASAFTYSRLKEQQAKDVIANSLKRSVLYACFGQFAKNSRMGPVYISTGDDLRRSLDDLVAGAVGVRLYANVSTSSSDSLVMYRLYRFFELVFRRRLSAAIFKFLTNYNYGYNLVCPQIED